MLSCMQVRLFPLTIECMLIMTHQAISVDHRMLNDRSGGFYFAFLTRGCGVTGQATSVDHRMLNCRSSYRR